MQKLLASALESSSTMSFLKSYFVLTHNQNGKCHIIRPTHFGFEKDKLDRKAPIGKSKSLWQTDSLRDCSEH